MGGGLPRRWAQSFSNVPVVANMRRAAALEAKEAAVAVAGKAKRLAWLSAARVGGFAGEAARSASEAVRHAAEAKAYSVAHSAKLLAAQGAHRTRTAVLEGGGALRRQAASYIKANVHGAAEGLRIRSGLAMAQMQHAFSEYSLKFMQAATDYAVRIISKQEQPNGQTKGDNAITPINIVTAEPKKTPEDTSCSSKIQ